MDVSRLNQIPSNFNSITWIVRDKTKKTLDLFKLDANKHKINQMIESIVKHFDHCSTDIIANELLHLYKKDVDPSAFFVAEVFLYISKMDSLAIESRNEFITVVENADNVELESIPKSPIVKQKQISKTQQQNKTSMSKKNDKTILDMYLNELGLSVRTITCLNRVGLMTVGEIVKKTREEIRNVRNFDKRGFDELVNKLAEMKLSFRDE